MTHTRAEFSVRTWDEQPYQQLDDGTKLTRASVTRTYSGGIEGEGASESLMYYAQDGTATIVGLERVVGKIGKNSGSFVVESRATFSGNKASGTWSVVPGSGADQLAGLEGEGEFAAVSGPNGSVDLDYELE
jgi:hypothetical protein